MICCKKYKCTIICGTRTHDRYWPLQHISHRCLCDSPLPPFSTLSFKSVVVFLLVKYSRKLIKYREYVTTGADKHTCTQTRRQERRQARMQTGTHTYRIVDKKTFRLASRHTLIKYLTCSFISVSVCFMFIINSIIMTVQPAYYSPLTTFH